MNSCCVYLEYRTASHNRSNLAVDNCSNWVSLLSSEGTGSNVRLSLSRPKTYITNRGNEPWLLVGLCGPVAGTSAVVIGTGVASIPAIPAGPIWSAPFAMAADDLEGSCDGFSPALVRPSLGVLLGKTKLISRDTYL